MNHSALYLGDVMHQRLRPKAHRLDYKMYSVLLDLDELEALNQRLRFFSIDRWNLFSFYRSDRGDGSGRDLRLQVENTLRAAGLIPDGGPIRLLTMPRILGWSFNPLSIFYCYSRDETLKAVLFEVDNTFGERHAYLTSVEEGQGAGKRSQGDKVFYVSPFMPMKMHYDFTYKAPDARLFVGISVFDTEGLVLTTQHRAERQALNDRALLRLFFRVPFLTLRVLGGIHWEALKLWLKGVKLVEKPVPPAHPVTLIEPRAVLPAREPGADG
jgi:uncharacterized protein